MGLTAFLSKSNMFPQMVYITFGLQLDSQTTESIEPFGFLKTSHFKNLLMQTKDH